MRRSASGFAITSMPSNWIRPEVGICSVATHRISVDLPAPFGPSRPNMPRGTSRVTDSSARVPFGYTCVRWSIVSIGRTPVNSLTGDCIRGSVRWASEDGLSLVDLRFCAIGRGAVSHDAHFPQRR